jgi:AcrR family transcriptional regulator
MEEREVHRLPRVSTDVARGGRTGELQMRVSGEKRRKQILEVARGLCAEKGFSGTTLDDIAEGAGISRALVVQHFGSKEGVYEALSEVAARAHPLEKDLEVKRRIAARDDYGVFRACAEHVFENNLRDAKRSNVRLTVYSMLENPDLFLRFAQARDGAWEGVISYIEARQREGAFGPVDARKLVEGYRSCVVHWAAEVLHGKQPANRELYYEVVDTVIRVMLAGLTASRSDGAASGVD